MILLDLQAKWPVAIPLPFLDYAGRPRYSTISSPIANGFISRRSRFTKGNLSISVSWILTMEEYDIFRDFYRDALGNGTAIFELELKYPKHSTLTAHAVRFRGGYTATPNDCIWNITTELDVVNPIQLGSLAPLSSGIFTGYELFDIQTGLVLQNLAAPDYAGVEYYDEAMGAVFGDTATLTQQSKVDLLDSILGQMVSTNQTTYDP